MLANEHMTQWVLVAFFYLPYYLKLKPGTSSVNNMTSSANKYKKKQISYYKINF